MIQFLFTLPRRAPAALMLAGLGLSACAPMPVATAPQAPVASAVPAQSLPGRVISPYRSVQAPVSGSPVESAVPAAASPAPANPAPTGPTGPLDGRTGLHQSALVSVSGSAESQFIVLFRPGQTGSSNIAAAPAQLCGNAGVASSRTNSASAGSAMPGVQTMIVKCGAA